MDEFQVVVDSLTQWCVDHFTANERKALAERLSDSTLTFADEVGAKAAASASESLGK